jgi:uncharacterized protein (TIGR03545 family)
MIWLKKGALVRLIGGCAVLWLLAFLAFDPALKWGLQKAGRAAAGAKVDIASVDSKWLRGTLDVSGVAVADKNAPMKNVVEASRLVFIFDVGAALRGKGVVREASIEGLRFGTARATSGALPNPPPPSKLELAIKEKLGAAAGSALAGTPVGTNAAATVDATKLAGLKKLDEAKAKAQEIQDRWKSKQGESADIAKQAQQVSDDLKGLGGGGDMLKKAQKASEAQKKLKDLIARVDASREQAKKDLAEVQDLYKQADELRGKDVNGLLSAAGLPSLDSQDLARRLVGAQTASRLSTVLHWMRVAREKAAANKRASSASAAPSAPARRQGLDIEFPRAHSYPQFLLENAKLAGSLDQALMGRDLAVAGLLNGVTSNPDLYGKPATLTLLGSSSSGESMRLACELDQQNDPVGVSVKFAGQGFSLAGAALGDGQFGGTLTAGKAAATGELSSVGDEWKGEILFTATGVKLEPKVSLDGAAGKAVSDALGSLDKFTVRIGLSGNESDLQLTFSSDIGEVLAGAMKKAFAGRFDAQRKAAEAKVAALYDPKLKDAHGATDGLSSQILGPLDSQKAGLERQLQDALKKSIGGAPDLHRFFK